MKTSQSLFGDRDSKLKVDDAVRDLSVTNTAIYGFGFSTGKSEAAHYAYRELPGSHRYSNPPHQVTRSRFQLSLRRP
jgi:hypothetical protein